MGKEEIKLIIDKYLQRWIDIRANKLPVDIEPEMADLNQNEDEEWRIWLPIESKVILSDIKDFEQAVGCKIPIDYVSFLMHKHFYELHISQANFCHPVNVWKKKWSEIISEGYSKGYSIAKGYLPFAIWGDWGLLCFNTNGKNLDFNYPVVIWDHESGEFEDKADDFCELLLILNHEEKQRAYTN